MPVFLFFLVLLLSSCSDKARSQVLEDSLTTSGGMAHKRFLVEAAVSVINPGCNGSSADYSHCCSNTSYECWVGIYTWRRCCLSRTPVPSSCDDSDQTFTNDLERAMFIGLMPDDWMPPHNVTEFSEFLFSDDLDDEVERCPTSALGRLLIQAELVSSLGTEQAMEASNQAWQVHYVLKMAAVVRGALSISPYHFPEHLLHLASWRVLCAQGLHEASGTPLKALVSHHIAVSECLPTLVSEDDVKPVFVLPSHAECFPTTSTSLMIELLLARPHSSAIAARHGRALGHLSTALAQLRAAVKHHGIWLSHSMEALASAQQHFIEFRTAKDSEDYPPGIHRFVSRIQFALPALQGDWLNINDTGEFGEVGGDKLLVNLLGKLDIQKGFFVELGATTGHVCNTRVLRQVYGWKGIMLDQVAKNEAIGLYRRFLTAGNVNRIFSELRVPGDFDVLSIDIDGNDFWMWLALKPYYRPRIVVIEYQERFGNLDVVSLYNHFGGNFALDNPKNVGLLGASARALVALAHSKSYQLVDCKPFYDLFFVRSDAALSLPQLALEDVPVRAESNATSRRPEFYTSSFEALGGAPRALDAACDLECRKAAFEQMCSEGHGCFVT